MANRVYFFPEKTHDGRNYHGYREVSRTRRVTAQLPCEGIYTEHEMSKFFPAPPGTWRKCRPRDVAVIFGLRQFIGAELPPEVRQ